MEKVTLLCLLFLVSYAVDGVYSKRSRSRKNKASNLDFFDLLDKEVAKDLASDGNQLQRSLGKLEGPRNNKYLDASIQIIKGMSAEGKWEYALGHRRHRKQKMIDAAVEATKANNIPKARSMVGYLIQQQLKEEFECQCPPEQAPCHHLPARCTTQGPKTTKPTKPTDPTTQQTTQPTDPTTQQTTQPTDPTTQQTTQPTDPTTQQTTQPTDPTTQPPQPTTHPNQHETVLKKLRAALGNDSFEILMGIKDDVSLIFTIDTTGTMGDEIEAAKNISKAISLLAREGDVNYILSPFADPTWGNVYKCDSQESFAEALDTLVAQGGGDCPELTLHGVVSAVELGDPYVGSPMFVFTDAGVKELPSTKYTMDNAIGLALDYRIPINVFYSTEYESCGSFNKHKRLVQLVEETEGFGLLFSSSGDIQKMGEVISAALDGTTTIVEGRSPGNPSGRVPRSIGSNKARDKIYTIPVDETVNTLFVTFFAEDNSDGAQLRDPDNTPWPQSEQLAQGGVWIVKNPARGVWVMFVPSDTGSHTLKVKSTSNFNLEFDYFFISRQKTRRNMMDYPIDHPLLGTEATVKLIVPLKKRLRIKTLVLSLIDETGADIKRATLSKQNLKGMFVPPDVPFKLKLSGQTKGGSPFQRISRTFVRAKNLALRLQRGLEYTTLDCSSAVTLRFVLQYVGKPNEKFVFTVNSSYAALQENTVYDRVKIARLSRVYFSLTFNTPSFLPDGEWNTFKVTVKKADSDDERDATFYTDHLRMRCAGTLEDLDP